MAWISPLRRSKSTLSSARTPGKDLVIPLAESRYPSSLLAPSFNNGCQSSRSGLGDHSPRSRRPARLAKACETGNCSREGATWLAPSPFQVPLLRVVLVGVFPGHEHVGGGDLSPGLSRHVCRGHAIAVPKRANQDAGSIWVRGQFSGRCLGQLVHVDPALEAANMLVGRGGGGLMDARDDAQGAGLQRPLASHALLLHKHQVDRLR